MTLGARDPLAALVAPLFVPAHRPDRFAKAAASGADAVILDLEDAVPADAKALARSALTTSFTDLPVLVRVNAPGTAWFEADMNAVASLPLAGVMLPKAAKMADVAQVAARHSVLALIETAQGLAAARTIAASGLVARLAFGSIDYAADLGCAHERAPLAAARAELVFASRLAGLPAPLDGVTTSIEDLDPVTRDAVDARSFGFGGKLLIHPLQVQNVFGAFAPSDADIAWAQRILAGGDGATKIDGEMVDEPVRIRARAILDLWSSMEKRAR